MKKLLLLSLFLICQLAFSQVDESIMTLNGEKGTDILTFAFGPDSKTIASGSRNGIIKLWDISSGKSFKVFEGHTDEIHSIAFSPDGKQLISTSGYEYSDKKDYTLRLWDINTGQCLKVFSKYPKPPVCAVFSPDGKMIATGDRSGKIILWDVATGKKINSVKAEDYTILKIAFSLDGKGIFADGIAGLYNLDINTNIIKCIVSKRSRNYYCNGCYDIGVESSISFDRNFFIVRSTGVYNGTDTRSNSKESVLLYKLNNSSQLFANDFYKIFTTDIGTRELDISPNDLMFSTNTFNVIKQKFPENDSIWSVIKLWNVGDGKCIKTFTEFDRYILQTKFSPDGKLFAASIGLSALGDVHEEIKLWDISKEFNSELADGAGSVDVVTPVGKNYPVLSITSSSIKFTDANGNNSIDAQEDCKLTFEVSNTGQGNAYKLKKKITITGTKVGITAGDNYVFNVNAGDKTIVEVPIKAAINTEDGNVTFTIKIDEADGYGSDEYTIEVPTRKFISPLIEVADYSVTSSNGSSLKKKKPFDLQVLVQNTQAGLAEDITVELQVPANVTCLSGNTNQNIASLKAGETKSIVYELIVTDLYTSQIIPITIKLGEKMGKYAQNKSILLNLDQALAADKITVTAKPDEQADISITKGSLNVDVDINIPTGSAAAPHKYALIIGNEDYSSFQTGLSTEVNVDFAVNDAEVFKKYCIQTLGVPDVQVRLIKNGTASQIKQGLEWINKLAKLENGGAEIIFYYSGHGLPDDATKDAYLMPVDVSGANVQDGIKLDDVYSKLTEHPTKKTIVLLDACFSGGARNQGLVAMKGSKLKPRDNSLNGNLVVLSSSTGEESSGVYRSNKHGYFTYFLLKKLQETKGDITLADLLADVKQKVQKQSTLESRPQTPGVTYSPAVSPVWENWKLK